MKNVYKAVALALCLSLCLGMAALAEGGVTVTGEQTVSDTTEKLPAELGDVDLYAPEVYRVDADEATVSNVSIDAKRFPDKRFRAFVKSKFDGNGDGVLSEAECRAVKRISVSRKGIGSLKGIEFFPNLEYLFTRGNRLTALNLSKNTALVEVDCSENRLKALATDKLPNLRKLCCYGNQIKRLKVSKNTGLEYLDCQGNGMIDLYMGRLDRLATVICFDNQLPRLDLRYLPALRYLDCWDNKLKKLNATQNAQLLRLRAYGNPLQTADIGNCRELLREFSSNEPACNSARITWGDGLSIPRKAKLMNGREVLYRSGKPSAVNLNFSQIKLGQGGSVHLVATVSPQGVLTKCTWSSSKPSVAQVNGEGIVTAMDKGTAKITVRTDNGKQASCDVTVTGIKEMIGYLGRQCKDVSKELGVPVERISGDWLNLKLTIEPGCCLYGTDWNDPDLMGEVIFQAEVSREAGDKYSLFGLRLGMNVDEVVNELLENHGWEGGVDRQDQKYISVGVCRDINDEWPDERMYAYESIDMDYYGLYSRLYYDDNRSVTRIIMEVDEGD